MRMYARIKKILFALRSRFFYEYNEVEFYEMFKSENERDREIDGSLYIRILNDLNKSLKGCYFYAIIFVIIYILTITIENANVVFWLHLGCVTISLSYTVSFISLYKNLELFNYFKEQWYLSFEEICSLSYKEKLKLIRKRKREEKNANKNAIKEIRDVYSVNALVKSEIENMSVSRVKKWVLYKQYLSRKEVKR